MWEDGAMSTVTKTWWTDIEKDVLDCLEGSGPLHPADLGRKLGMSEEAVTSVLSLMAADGKVRIRLVESAA